LKRERVEICTTTTLREGFGFRASKQLGAQALSSQLWSDPESQDVEPPPVDFAIDSTNKRATCISRNYAEALDLPRSCPGKWCRKPVSSSSVLLLGLLPRIRPAPVRQAA
jgi:hypothetical protein